MSGLFPSWHIHVSENVPGSDEACVAETGVEFCRLCHDRSIPATTQEGYDLRAETNDVGFSDFVQLRKQVLKRYGWALPASQNGWANFLADMKPGWAAIVTGDLDGWNSAEFAHWKRWYPSSHVDHAVTIYRFGPGPDDFAICDPGAPRTFSTGVHYAGERITAAALKSFSQYGYAHPYIAAPVLQEEVDMVPVPPNAAPSLVDIALGKQLYRLDKSALVKTSGPQFGKLSLPHADPLYRIVALDVGVDQLVLVKVADVTNVRPVCPPVAPPPADTSPYTQAQLDAAKGEAAKAGYNQGRLAVVNAANAVATK